MPKGKIALIVSGGLGDNITYSAKLPALLKENGVDMVDIYLVNTFNEITYMIVEFLEEISYVNNVNINTYPRSNYKKVVDWRPDDSSLPYPVDPNFEAPTTHYGEKWADTILHPKNNPIVIQPYTLNGNSSAQSEKYVRSPKEDWWERLFDDIKSAGGTPIVIGGEKEIVEWETDSVVTSYTDSFMWTISLILKSKGFIGINSWAWQIAHYSNKIDTCVLWLHNYHWVDLHTSDYNDRLTLFKDVPDNDKIIDSIGALR